MKVNLGIASQNSADWQRIIDGDLTSPPATADSHIVEQALALGDMAEPLGYDGIWVPEHFGTPYGMTPNPLQLLAYFAGRTERVTFGTQIVVVPWWNPVRLVHQIAYLDIISKGRYETIGLGRGVAKSEFNSLGIPRETSMKRFEETIDILELAFTQDRFSYEGEIFQIPETELRPAPISKDLFSRLYGASATGPSLEMISRRGVKPLFVGNKPLSEAAKDVRHVNTMRAEVGLPPCQPKNILFTYCVASKEEAAKADQYLADANRNVVLAYGLNDPANFRGVKGYESYASRSAGATAPSADAAKQESKPAPKGYDQSNLMIGTPDMIIERIVEAQKACSFSEISLMPQFGTMPYSEAAESVKLFAQEVLPVVQKMETPLHAAALPETEASEA